MEPAKDWTQQGFHDGNEQQQKELDGVLSFMSSTVLFQRHLNVNGCFLIADVAAASLSDKLGSGCHI